jgi:hypothetical protein
MMKQLRNCDAVWLRMEDNEGNEYRAHVEDFNIEIDKTMAGPQTVASIDGVIDLKVGHVNATTDTEYRTDSA